MRKVQWRNNRSNQHLDAKEPRVLKIFFIYMLMVVHMCTAHYRILIVCCSQRIWPAQFCTKRFFRGRSLWLAPTGPLHNPLLGGAEKSSLYAKQSCAAKPSLLGTNSSKQALLLLLLDCSLRIASGMVRIFFYVSIDHQHVRIIFQFWSQPNRRKGKRKVDLGWEPQRGLLKPSNGNRTAQKKVFCTLWPLVGQAA